MPSEPHGCQDEDRAGTETPAAADDGRTPAPAAIDTVFAPQDGLSGFIPQVIREERLDMPEPSDA